MALGGQVEQASKSYSVQMWQGCGQSAGGACHAEGLANGGTPDNFAARPALAGPAEQAVAQHTHVAWQAPACVLASGPQTGCRARSLVSPASADEEVGSQALAPQRESQQLAGRG